MVRKSRIGFALLIATAALFSAASSASALPFELVPEGFKVESTRVDGSLEAQAGAHPFGLRIVFEVVRDGEGWPSGGIHDVLTKLPPGLIANPEAAPRCPRELFSALVLDEVTRCPAASQIGVARVSDDVHSNVGIWPVFLLPAPQGVAATIGFPVDKVGVIVNNTLDTAGDYGVEAASLKTSMGLPVYKVDLTLWGSPQDPVHDAERFCGKGNFSFPPSEPCPVDAPRTPFLTNPTICAGPQTSVFSVDSWQELGAFRTQTSTSPPFGGCNLLRFSSTLGAVPDAHAPASPTGLAVDLDLPQSDDPDTGFAPSTMRDASVTLPRGMAINAASADGLDACTDAQLGLGSKNPISCPDASKLGTVTADTPLLDHPLEGNVYLRTQASQDPASGEMFRLAMVFDDPERGLLIKLPGQVRVDPGTGQINTVFPDNPPLPVSHIALDLKTGPRAPLTTPGSCGSYEITGDFSPWSGGAPVRSTSSFKVDRDCGRGSGFAPSFDAGTTNPIAGWHSSFALRIAQGEGEHSLSGLTVSLPPGLSATLAGVPLCSDSAANSGSCPSASRVGSTTVGVGAGAHTLYVPQPGRPATGVYLAGPYKGAPYSLVVEVPAQAGPFDLGTVTVRNALYVDQTTAEVTATSDPLPQVVKGIPIAYRDVRIDIDRPDFTLNPTSCNPMSIGGALSSAGGQSVSRSSRFQVAGCGALGFKPKLSLALKGARKRSGNPALRAVLKAPRGQANIAATTVILPSTQFIDNAHINNPCTRVQFNAHACPPSSVLGTATAYTPLLDQPLSGPVYFRSNGGERELPDLVADLNGQIHVVLVGFIDSVAEKHSERSRVRTRFLTVPDAPVSRFEMKLFGGKRGLIENSTNLCRKLGPAIVKMDGQNGKVNDFKQRIATGCRKGKKKAHR